MTSSGTAPYPLQKKKKERPFIFEDHPSRKIALRLAYHGHVHDGLAIQKETANTVEGHLCTALKQLRFVPSSGPQKLSRCGRTDKGVSALGNCIALMARSSCWPTDEVQLAPIDYASKLNHVLPSTIRIVGYSHVPDAFDARFSCKARSYRYYFCHRGLNVAAMQEAAQKLVGTHCFRNFCVLDVVNVSNFDRTVEKAEIHNSSTLPELISYFEIKSNSFLYHQVRCIMEVLFLVGRQLETSDVVTELLTRGDRKPQYGLADSTPLVLWHCHYDESLQWQLTQRSFQEVDQQLHDIATALMIRAASAEAMRQQMALWYTEEASRSVVSSSEAGKEAMSDEWGSVGCDWTQPRSEPLRRSRRTSLLAAERQTGRAYVPLLKRPTERTFDEQVQQLSEAKRARFDVNVALKAAGSEARNQETTASS